MITNEGKDGTVISDINRMNTVVVEGAIIGNIRAERLIMRGNASLQGDVHCSSVVMGSNTTMIGQMHSLFDPSTIGKNGPRVDLKDVQVVVTINLHRRT